MAADVVFEVEDKLLLCRWEDMSWPLASTVLHVELALDVSIVSAVYGGGGSTRKKKNCSHKRAARWDTPSQVSLPTFENWSINKTQGDYGIEQCELFWFSHKTTIKSVQ